MDLRDLVLPAYAQMLDALSGQIDKAERQGDSHGSPPAELLAARLAPDMFPLASQIQFVCIQAEEARSRLVGDTPHAPEVPATLAAARTLLAATAQRLRETAGGAAGLGETSPVELALPNGMIFDMPFVEYVRSWSIPQFYFHLVTAYAIMRHVGIDIGKADYVPHMHRFLRKT